MDPIEEEIMTEAQDSEPETLPKYEPPRVITYRGEELLEALGPMQACTFNGAVLVC